MENLLCISVDLEELSIFLLISGALKNDARLELQEGPGNVNFYSVFLIHMPLHFCFHVHVQIFKLAGSVLLKNLKIMLEQGLLYICISLYIWVR